MVFKPFMSRNLFSNGFTINFSLSSADIPGKGTETNNAGISISGSPSFGNPVYAKIPAARDIATNTKIIRALSVAQSIIPVIIEKPYMILLYLNYL